MTKIEASRPASSCQSSMLHRSAPRPTLDRILSRIPGTDYVKGYLNPQRIQPGQRSLHLGSGNSMIPFAEALLGLEVIVTDTREALADVEAAREKFMAEARKEGSFDLKLEIRVLDILNFLQEFPPNHFDHIYCQNVLNYRALVERIERAYGKLNTAAVWIMLLSKMVERLKNGGTLSLGSEHSALALPMVWMMRYVNEGNEFSPGGTRDAEMRESIRSIGARKLYFTGIGGPVRTPTLIDYGWAADGAIFRVDKR